ncbi:MAG TPA: zf-HC2 domain-containing protein [Acidobacteriaceae bacterium]
MQADLHNTMHQLIDKSLVGEVSLEEQQTLREHLAACADCQRYASECQRAIAALSGFSFATDPALHATVNAALVLRAQQMQAMQPDRTRIVVVSVVALFLTLAGSFGAAHISDPLAAFLHLPAAQTQTGLFTLWIIPSWCFFLLLPVLLLISARSANRKGQIL